MLVPFVHSYQSSDYNTVEPWTLGFKLQFSPTKPVEEAILAYVVVSHFSCISLMGPVSPSEVVADVGSRGNFTVKGDVLVAQRVCALYT